MIKKNFVALAALVAISALSIAKTQEKDIVDTAVGAGKFTTLVKLVQAAGLVDTLKSEGPFTVLAPTDTAFAKLMKKYPKLGGYLTDHTDVLKKVLLYHVISGSVLSTDLKNGTTAKTVEGEKVHIMVGHGKVAFNRHSKVVIADVRATNGVIHAIDTVLLPPSLVKAVQSMNAKTHKMED